MENYDKNRKNDKSLTNSSLSSSSSSSTESSSYYSSSSDEGSSKCACPIGKFACLFVSVILVLVAVAVVIFLSRQGKKKGSTTASKTEQKIINNYPFIVRIDNGCSGILIQLNIVLTPAFCVYELSDEKLVIAKGLLILGGLQTYANMANAIRRVSKKIIPHEKYKSGSNFRPHFNIALIILNKPFNMSSYTRPIDYIDYSFDEVKRVSVIGWSYQGNNLLINETKTKSDNSGPCRENLDDDGIAKVGFCIANTWPGTKGSAITMNVKGNKKLVGYTIEDGKELKTSNTNHMRIGPFINWIRSKMKSY